MQSKIYDIYDMLKQQMDVKSFVTCQVKMFHRELWSALKGCIAEKSKQFMTVSFRKHNAERRDDFRFEMPRLYPSGIRSQIW